KTLNYQFQGLEIKNENYNYYFIFCFKYRVLFHRKNIVEKPYTENNVKFDSEIIYPEHSKPMNVTVYRFSDFSGQRKQGLLYQEASTAVPQGLDSMLMHSLSGLNDGKLYKVIDRTFLAQMLDERQLASVSVSPKSLGVLKVPSIVFTGGVIAYDHNNKQAAGGFSLMIFRCLASIR
uniref:CsgG/HfaB family protein n=1 Tax=Vibrio sp. 624788 TaxID=1234362 RepID=UPI00240A28F5